MGYTHPQVPVVFEGRDITVDVELVELLELFWSHGCRTAFSCQGDDGETAHFGFENAASLELALEVLRGIAERHDFVSDLRDAFFGDHSGDVFIEPECWMQARPKMLWPWRNIDGSGEVCYYDLWIDRPRLALFRACLAEER